MAGKVQLVASIYAHKLKIILVSFVNGNPCILAKKPHSATTDLSSATTGQKQPDLQFHIFLELKVVLILSVRLLLLCLLSSPCFVTDLNPHSDTSKRKASLPAIPSVFLPQ